MPFKSKAQQRKFFSMEGRGEIPKGTSKRWANHTKDIDSLPERKSKKKKKNPLITPGLGRRFTRNRVRPNLLPQGSQAGINVRPDMIPQGDLGRGFGGFRLPARRRMNRSLGLRGRFDPVKTEESQIKATTKANFPSRGKKKTTIY